MPVVTVQLWTGRTVAQKRRLAKAITDAMVEIAEVRPDGLHIIFQDYELENWARAGILGADREDHNK